MYTPHTVTLYIVTENNDFTTNIDTTILDGVFLDTTQSKGTSTRGTSDADNATLFVPFSVKAHGIDGNEKTFIDSKQYRAMENPAGFWTLESGGDSSGADCYFVKGAIYQTLEYGEAKKLYNEVYKVSKIVTRDFGTKAMQHWQVGAV